MGTRSTRSPLVWGPLVLIAVLLAAAPAVLALTDAGEIIGNSATAVYFDENNNEFNVTSNIVQTTVLAVCGVAVTPGAAITYEAAVGTDFLVPVTVTNTGNSARTYNLTTATVSGGPYTKTVVEDDNGVEGDPVTQISLNAGQSVSLFVKIMVGAVATNDETFSFTATATDDGSCTDTSADILVDLVSDAVITVTKGVDRPSAAPGDTLTYTVTFENVGTVAAKSRLTYDPDGDGTPQAIDFDGGGNDEGILFSDPIPAGTTYVSGSASGTVAGAFVAYSTDGGITWTNVEPAPLSAITHLGFFLPDPNPNNGTRQDTFDAGNNGQGSFQVAVDDPFGDSDGEVNNVVTVEYADSSDTDRSVTTREAVTAIPAAGTADIAVGGAVAGASAYEEDAATNWQDDNTVAQVPAGYWVTFEHTAQNRDTNRSDLIDLSVENLAGLPGGTIVEFWNADQTARLIDNGGSNDADLGSLAPGQQVTFTVRVYVPATATAGFEVDILATSDNNPAEQDRSRNTITALILPAVDLGGRGLTGDGTDNPADGNTDPAVGNGDSDDLPLNTTPADPLYNPPVTPGDTAQYPLELVNTGGAADSFALSFSGAPAGTTVTFFTDPACDGNKGGQVSVTPLLGGSAVTADVTGDTLLPLFSVANFVVGDTVIVNPGAASPVTATVTGVDPLADTLTIDQAVTLNQGDGVAERFCVLMEVETQSDTDPGDYNVTVTVTSSNSGASDDMDVALGVLDVCAVAFTLDKSGSVAPVGTVTYPHTITNNGNSAVDVTIAVPGSGTQLTYTLLDSSLNPQGNSFVVAGLAPMATVDFSLRVFAPQGTAGVVEVVTITATASPGGCQDTALDTTQVIEGFLDLNKFVDKASAAPGDVVTYKVCFENIGGQDAVKVVITDNVPDQATFVPGSLGLQDPPVPGSFARDVTYDDAVGSAGAADQGEFDAAAGTNGAVRFRVGTGASAVEGGTLAPGDDGCVIFQVVID